MAGCISCAAVYLAGVLSGESTTTVSTLATVSINNNLTACQTGISMRTTDHKFPGRVDMIDNLIVEQCQHFIVVDGSDDTRHQDVDNITTDDRQHLFVSLELSFGRIVCRLNKVVMLGRNYNRINTNGSSVVVIFNRYLALGVGAKVSHHLSFTTNVGKNL